MTEFNNPQPVVVIPVYKELQNWGHNEIVSLQRCCHVLGNHPFYLIGPGKLNWILIEKFVTDRFGKKVHIASFENSYFADIPGYNRLLKSLFFYEYFSSYSHLLLYQLDAFVFRDDLLEWCNKGYDYVGAPWLEGLTDNNATKLIGVGNGGFSLHNIASSIKILKKIRLILPILEKSEMTALYQKFPQTKWLTRYVLLKVMHKIKNQRYVKDLSLSNQIYEDVFWGRYIPTTFCDFKVAPIDEALKFSFEVNPRYLYSLNNETLPFGCHAWEKYDPNFWSQFIKGTVTFNNVK